MSTKTKKLIVANWKMNPETPREARELFGRVKRLAARARAAHVVVCPPALWLPLMRSGVNLELGGQDLSAESVGSGAFTGSVSGAQLKYAGATYVLIGHSERRASGETDELIQRKLRAALRAGLRPILCVGERARDANGDYLQIIRQSLETATAEIPRAHLARLVVAYEPIWAIGEGANGADTPNAFLEQAIFIRRVMSQRLPPKQASALPVLYGGSVNEENAAAFLTIGAADGLLVGRASLGADKFAAIVKAAAERI